MNIYKYAMKMEKDGENYYRELANKTEDIGLQNILKMLADEEVRHYNIIEQMMKSKASAELAETGILKKVKNIFIKIKGKNLVFNFDLPQINFYRKAQEIEEKSYKFYIEMSDKVEIESQRKVFLKLAGEEKKHMFLLENLVEFVSRPETWIENAEFNHLDDY
ncbi:MAG: ferritin family protein [Candidatus Atribacteria bacterium]|jgi:rubrerythrin|nr:ferritin family protein [Candidatus Atribacteria bacterium]